MTPSKEDYIKAIHSLDGAREIVSNKALSHALNVSAASVTDMNSRLLEEDLITYIPYQGVKLTEKGILTARKLIRKHRIWETFLYEFLDYNWEDVHPEADLLEHVSSDRLINKLSELLNHPTRDPHGGIIPRADGSIDVYYYIALSDAKIGETFAIREVSDHADILQYAYERELVPGEKFKLLAIDDLEGPLTLRNSKGDKILVSHKAAQEISIELLND
ncbi:metal-dependent transcriptional regulator [Allofustis seminis]|uniref:metal-dependent transcriptional regulator n=1 Tax=Allofustis seminis TaxID=166939 RepID=UPI0003605C78|nr:metal-dependent transcriptional regulator [Allofustis seminis]